MTRSQATRLIESGEVAVNGRAVSKSYKLAGGEDIAVTLPEPEPVEAVPQDIPLDVVYEDADVIVVNKPSGMVVHPAPGHPDGTLVNALLYHCAGTLSGVGGALRPGIVHRIDRDTSGLIIAAKNDAAHQYLSAQLADHTLARTYECIVVGSLREDRGTVDAPIASAWRWSPAGARRSRIGRSSPAIRAIPTSAAGSRRDARTRSASTWPTSGIPFSATRYTVQRRRSPA